MNILVVKPSSLGDIIHTFPAVQLVRQQFPEAVISWVVSEQLTGIVDLFATVDETIVFRRHRLSRFVHWREVVAFCRECRSRQYDVALDFQGLLRSGLMAFISGAKRRIGFANAREGAALFYTERVRLPSNLRHAVDKNLFLVRSAFDLAVAEETPQPQLTIRHGLVECADRLVRQHDLSSANGVLAVAAAARWQSKSWPPAFFAGVIDEVATRYPAVRCWLLGTAGERPVLESVAAHCRRTVPVNLGGETDLGTTAELLRRSDVLLTNDSGPMHLAALLGVPTVSLFGPTDPALTGPVGDNHVVFAGTCSEGPCFQRVCPQSNQLCFENVHRDHVVDAVAQRLRNTIKENGLIP